MKIYVRSGTVIASTTDELKTHIINKLKNNDNYNVEYVKVSNVTDTYGKGKIKFSEAENEVSFNAELKFKRNTEVCPTQWRPGLSVNDDGSISDETGTVIGYIKILKKPPTTSTRDYDLDDISIYVTKKITDDLDLHDTDSVLSTLYKLAVNDR